LDALFGIDEVMFRNTILLSLVLGVTVSTGAQTQPWKFRVEFEGNKIFSTDILLKELSSCPAKRSDLADRYDVGVFDYCLRKHVRDFLWTHGYITAEIGKPREQRDESGLEVIVPIDEGPRYRLGSISIRGEKYFTSKQLLEKLKLKSGDIADARELQ
jgi:outer membrane protein insertion porin family